MIRDKLTMIPGPTPVHGSVLKELAEPTVSHQDPTHTAAFSQCLERLKQVVRGEASHPFVVGGAGTLAMEMALVNVLAPGERLLIVSHGYFGDRYGQVAEAFGIESELLASEWGTTVDLNLVREKLASGAFSALAMTHVDTSTGVAAPVAELAELAEEHGVLKILDGVCATAGMDERFDDWKLDLLLTGAQKALAAPPGVGILFASDRAMEKRKSLGQIHAYYADLLRWQPIMENPALYFSTPPVNEIFALNHAAGMIIDEGLDARFKRHQRLAAGARAAFDALGLELFTQPHCRADTLSVPIYPAGIDDAKFRAGVAERGVVLAGALGPVAGKAFRMGHMGSIGLGELATAVSAVEETLAALGQSVEAGSAAAAAAKAFHS